MGGSMKRLFKVGDLVHYTNDAGVYWGVFKIIGLDVRNGGPTYFLENDGNPKHWSVCETNLRFTK